MYFVPFMLFVVVFVYMLIYFVYLVYHHDFFVYFYTIRRKLKSSQLTKLQLHNRLLINNLLTSTR